MLPLITAALGLLQNQQQDAANRKRDMQAAAMGKFAQMPPPKGGDLSEVGKAFDEELAKPKKPKAGPADPPGTTPLGQENPTGNPVSAIPQDDAFGVNLSKFDNGQHQLGNLGTANSPSLNSLHDDDLQRRIDELSAGLQGQ